MKQLLAFFLSALWLASATAVHAQQAAEEAQSRSAPATDAEEKEDEESAAKARFNEALKKRDWGAVLDVAEELAEDGDAEAQGVLGIIYYEGLEVEQSSQTASEWLSKSVAQGFESARALLGRVQLELGNYEEAEPHLEKTANDGNSVSMLLLASLYGNAPGEGRDPSKAMYWLVKSGARNQLARKTIANLYPVLRPGKQLSVKDREKFVGFFEEAARSADTEDVMALATMYATGKNVDVDLDAALQWYGIAARQGDPEGQVKFANTIVQFKQEGKPIEADLAALRGSEVDIDSDDESKIMTQIAVDHLYSAAAQGYAEAMAGLGRLYIDDDVLPRDLESAYTWLTLAKLSSEKSGKSLDTASEATLARAEREILNDDASGQSALANATRRARKHDGEQSLPDKPRVLAADSKRLVVAGDSVNLRRGPGTNNEIVTHLDSGQEVLELAMVDGWSQIQVLDGKEQVGWISSGLLRHKIPQRGGKRSRLIVTGKDVNVHSEPGDAGIIFLRVDDGQEATEIERSGEWVKVRLRDRDESEGWIHASFLKREHASAKRRAAPVGSVHPSEVAGPAANVEPETAVQPQAPFIAADDAAGGTEGAPEGERLVVTANDVNVRAGPGLDEPVAFQVDIGTSVLSIARVGDWAQVTVLDGSQREGWIHADLLRRDDSDVVAEPTESTDDRAQGAQQSQDVAAADAGGATPRAPEPSAEPPAAETSESSPAAAPTASSGPRWIVDRPTVNLRASPTVDDVVVLSLRGGQEVIERRRAENWVFVEVEVPDEASLQGWMYLPLLRPAEPDATLASSAPRHRVAADVGVNVRAGPGTEHDVVYKLAYGRVLEQLSRQNSWVEVAVPGTGTVGWVLGSLIEPFGGADGAGAESDSGVQAPRQGNVEPTPPEAASEPPTLWVVQRSSVDIRMAPDTNAPIIATLSQGQQAEATARQSGWLRVLSAQFQGPGWVEVDGLAPKEAATEGGESSATGGELWYISGDLVNIRAGAGEQYPVLRQAQQGAEVIALERVDDWTHVRFGDGDDGWISSSLLSR